MGVSPRWVAAMTNRYDVKILAGRAILPPTGAPANPIRISTWSDSEANLRRFVAISNSTRSTVDPNAVEVHLVNRADNPYNPNAISVVMPSVFGGELDARHIGYL